MRAKQSHKTIAYQTATANQERPITLMLGKTLEQSRETRHTSIDAARAWALGSGPKLRYKISYPENRGASGKAERTIKGNTNKSKIRAHVSSLSGIREDFAKHITYQPTDKSVAYLRARAFQAGIEQDISSIERKALSQQQAVRKAISDGDMGARRRLRQHERSAKFERGFKIVK